MTLRLLLLTFFLMLLSLSSIGQNRINFFHLTPKMENENILIINTVEDKMGYIWMSHIEGISRYDGYDFSFYAYETIFKEEAIEDNVEKIEIDQSGILWVLSSAGKIAKRLPNGEFINFNKKFSSQNSFSPIETIIAKKDAIWFAGNNGNLNSINNNTLIIGLFLLGLILFKIIATSLTFGAGGIGGVFAPTLFTGSLTGSLFDFFMNYFFGYDLFLINFAMVGMAGLMAGVLLAPLTAIFLIAEITGGYELFIPLMICMCLYGIASYGKVKRERKTEQYFK